MKWPSGITSSGASCGIKGEGRSDLAVIVVEESCAWAGTFTHNAAAAAPVLWSRSLLGREVRAIVVNSGNANACTGEAGVQAVRRTTRRAAEVLGCDPEEVLVASTGVIGVPLPVELIEGGLPDALQKATSELDPFATAILTTDTVTKVASTQIEGCTLTGVAKGAAMLAPNMATMLAFITTDADIPGAELEESLQGAVESSFNRISVDACESTNDSVFLLATGHGSRPDRSAFADALTTVCRDLAHQMVADAEGGSKVVRIQIEGARDEAHAVELGRSIAASALWRAAVHGSDPNWGRVASALGQSDRSLQLSSLDISIGPETVFERGEPTGSLEAAKKAMEEPEFDVTCRVGAGAGAAEILTSDLSTQYVVENAWGTT